jgi:hypothetical protein
LKSQNIHKICEECGIEFQAYRAFQRFCSKYCCGRSIEKSPERQGHKKRWREMIATRNYYLLNRYGITQNQYDELLQRQGGGCAICGKTPEQEGKNLAVDHIHSGSNVGEIRGILCSYHNHRVVGKHTDPILLRKVADYIDGPHTGWFVPKKKPKKRKKKK